MVNLELREKFMWCKNTREFYDNKGENISGESIGVQRLFKVGAY